MGLEASLSKVFTAARGSLSKRNVCSQLSSYAVKMSAVVITIGPVKVECPKSCSCPKTI